MNHKKTGRPQVSAGPDCVDTPVLTVMLDGVILVYAWVAASGDLIVLESSYSLTGGHEVASRPPEWLAELMGWRHAASQSSQPNQAA